MKNTILAFLFAFGIFAVPTMAENENNVAEKPKSAAEAPVATTLVQGRVSDMVTGESLAGAEVSIEGTNIKAFTDLDGNFVIEGVKPGKYNIICSLISYNKSLVENLNVAGTTNHKCEIALEASR